MIGTRHTLNHLVIHLYPGNGFITHQCKKNESTQWLSRKDYTIDAFQLMNDKSNENVIKKKKIILF